MHSSETELHRALGVPCNPSKAEQGCGKQGSLRALSLLPRESLFFCFRDQSLLREELSGLKQLQHPWECRSKTVGNSWPRPNRSAGLLRP